jgi:hypothetical protein
MISVPRKWIRFVQRLFNLKPGRYVIVLSVYADACDWSVHESTRIER